MKAPIKEGIVAISKKGRDKGHMFVVLLSVDTDFVLVADGQARTLAHMKRKRRKHLLSTAYEYPDMVRRYTQNSLRDEEIFQALESVKRAQADKEEAAIVQK